MMRLPPTWRDVLAPYTTRLQKGGALLNPLRQLSLAWAEASGGLVHPVISGALGLTSRREADVVRRAFVPRLVRSQPPNLWRTAAILERHRNAPSLVVPLHYYATACAEPLLSDFVEQFLYPLAGTGHEVGTVHVLRFIEQQPEERFPAGRWTKTVSTKVARGLLAALRGYGVLAGRNTKRIAAVRLSGEAFALLARIRAELGFRGEASIDDPVWRLFFLDAKAVQGLFAEAAAERLLVFNAAGRVVRVEFPSSSLEEYASLIASGTPAAVGV